MGEHNILKSTENAIHTFSPIDSACLTKSSFIAFAFFTWKELCWLLTIMTKSFSPITSHNGIWKTNTLNFFFFFVVTDFSVFQNWHGPLDICVSKQSFWAWTSKRNGVTIIIIVIRWKEKWMNGWRDLTYSPIYSI